MASRLGASDAASSAVLNHVVLALEGQAIHQVEIDGAEAGDAQQSHGALDHLERLDAADGFLHMRVEILHAEADAVEARAGKREREIAVDMARVEFDRDFGVGREIEMAAQGVGQRAQPFAAEQARRAAAPMGVDDFSCGRGFADEIDLARERLGIGVERLVALRVARVWQPQ